MKILLMLPESRYVQTYSDFLEPMQDENITLEVDYVVGTVDPRVHENDADIIVARGITYLALKQCLPDKQYVELAISSYDLIEATLDGVAQYDPQRIAVYLNQHQLANGRQLERLLSCQVDLYDVSDEEDIRRGVEIAKAQGTDLIIGGGTSIQYAKAAGIPSTIVRSSITTIQFAMRQAVEMARAMNMERARIDLLQGLLNSSRDAIVAVNRQGCIMAANRLSKHWLNLPPQSDWDKAHPIDAYLLGCPWRKALEQGFETEVLLPLHNKIYLVTSKSVPNVRGEPLVLITVQDATEIQKKESKIRSELNKKGLLARYTFDDIKGNSPVLQRTISTARKYSKALSNVLLTGESGTGKELFAHSIHNASNRKNQAFVAINCAALPENLLESELFGYVEGAFSGASKGGKSGLFELAHQGTLFMDEIGEMPLPLQAKLLRVLQEREVRRVGGENITSIDVRVIAATNVDLEALVKEGKFRLDLYYRLNILAVEIPPLRLRSEDIPAAFDFSLARLAKQYGVVPPRLTVQGAEMIQGYPWPGNMRQLQNVCERIIALDERGIIDQEALAQAGIQSMVAPAPPTEEDALCGDVNPQQLQALLSNGQYSKADIAKILGISRTTLWRKLKEQGLCEDK